LSPGEVERLFKLGRPTIRAADNTGLVGYWAFDEGQGTRADDYSGNENDGTLESSMTDDDWVQGRVGGALGFDGSDDYVNTNLNTHFTPITISSWVRLDTLDTGSDQRIIEKREAGIEVLGLNIKINTGIIEFFRIFDGGGGDWKTPTDTLTINTWHHVAVTYDDSSPSNDAIIYVDGVSQSLTETSRSGTANTNTDDYIIGNRGAADRPFSGLIDEVRIYNRALSASEVENLFKSSKHFTANVSQTNKITDGLVGMWSFDGPDMYQNTALDRSGNDNNGTLTNGPLVTPGKVGQALEFDGVDDFVEIADDPSTDFTGDFSLVAWAKSGGPAEHRRIISRRSGGGCEVYFLRYRNNNVAQLAITEDCTQNSVDGTTNLSDNTWHHVVGIRRGNFLEIYVDGVLENDQSGVQTGSINPAAPFFIGTEGAVEFWNGLIDEVRIYDRALSSDEIKRLYNMGR